MIKGERRKALTAEEILRHISPSLIYHKYFGDFKVNEPCFNHLRNESERGSPSFIIGNKYGELFHSDFSAGKAWSGDCFKLVMQIHQCSYDKALRIIDRDFGLGISSNDNTGLYKELRKEYKQPEEEGKRYALIQMITRKFTKEELDYWKGYYISEEDLRREHIYSIKEMFLNKKRFPIGDDLRFGYLYDGYWKVYFVNKDKRRKWVSNVPLITMRGLENLSPDKNTLICKSLKDYMVCKKVYPNVCHVQNESLSSFSKENIKFIKEHSKEVFYGGDSDEPGKRSSWEITSLLGYKHINPPDRLLPEIKDFADWAREEGLVMLEKHFKRKGLII